MVQDVNIQKAEKTPSGIIMTGATGFAGSHFLRVLRQQDKTRIKTLCLARSRLGKTAGSRVFEAAREARFAYIGAEDTYDIIQEIDNIEGRIEVIEDGGYFSSKNISNESKASDLFKNLSARIEEDALAHDLNRENLQFWHFAARLAPEKVKDDPVGYQNVEMTKKAIELSGAVGIKQFVLVSTAYVGGLSSSPLEGVLEKKPAVFRNTYEESKFHSERVAIELCAEFDMQLSIIRLPILIAPSVSFAGNLNTAIGKVHTALLCLREKAPHQLVSVLEKIHPEAKLDLLPVDQACRQMLNFSESLEGHTRQTQPVPVVKNIHPRAPVFAKQIAGLMLEETSVAEAGQEHAYFARNFSRREAEYALNFYLSYVRHPHRDVFARRLTHDTRIDNDNDSKDIQQPDLTNLIAASAREAHYGRIQDIFHCRTVQVQDGTELVVFDTRSPEENYAVKTDQPVLFFCNALSIPASILVPLASRAKQKGIRLISWESRGFPRLNAHFEGKFSTPWQHAQDGLDIIAQSGEKVFALAGWSTGALTASLIAKESRHKVYILHLLAGSYMMSGARLTSFQKNMKHVMSRAGRSEKIARQMYKMVFEMPQPDQSWLMAASRYVIQRQTSKILSANDPRLDHLTRQSVRSWQTAYRYANHIAGFTGFREWEEAASLDIPVHIWHAKDDAMAHIDGAGKFARMHRQAQTRFDREGGHFQLYQDEKFLEDLLNAVFDAGSRALNNKYENPVDTSSLSESRLHASANVK